MSLSFLRAAHEEPGRVAVVVAGEEMTFASLAARVAGEVELLRHLGLGERSERRAALVAAPTLATVVRLWALLELGAPALLLHPRLGAAERAAQAAIDPRAVNLDGLPPAAPAGTWVPHEAGDGEAFVVFTSGSTGRPKGVVLSRRAVLASAAASAGRLGWRDDDRWLLSLTPAHVGGLSIITRCLIARRPVVLPCGSSAEELLGAMAAQRVTLVSLVAAQLRRMMALTDAPPPAVRVLLTGGGPLAPELLAEAAARGWPVCPTYGLSETCSQVATQPPGIPEPAAGAGPALPGVELRVVDGEIQVRGGMVMDRYVPDGAHPDPFTADGWLATGDLGHLDGRGNLHLAGRRDEVIVSGGENVSPTEVEEALRLCPGVREALVFAVPDPVWGALVAAAIVPGEPPATAEGIARDLEGRLARFKQPRRVVFVEELPRTPSGKPDRRRAAASWTSRLRPLGGGGKRGR